MRIAYCTNVRLPSERAHGHQIASVVKALREMHHDVEIFAPFRKNSIEESFESYYGLSSPVQLHHLGSTDGIAAWWAPGVLGLKLTTYLLNRALRRIFRKRSREFDLIYTRTPEILSALTGHGIPVVIELHRIPRIGLRHFLRQLRKTRLVIALTSQMRQTLIDLGVSDVPVIVEGDAVDLHDFEGVPDARVTKTSLRVPDKVPLIVYAGQLSSMGLSKGIPELLGALKVLRQRGRDFRAVIAGGPAAEKVRFEAGLNEELKPLVQFVGHIAHLKVPTLLVAADVLVYPAPKSDHPYYMRDTSPLKLFEYMAAGRPIVAADLPPLRDAVNETMLSFCAPGDSESLAQAILSVLDEPEAAMKKAALARAAAENLTWEKRMKRILEAARIQS